MTDWPWIHREGHMRAKLVSETADTVTYDWEHLRVASWKGRETTDKPMFNRTWRIAV